MFNTKNSSSKKRTLYSKLTVAAVMVIVSVVIIVINEKTAFFDKLIQNEASTFSNDPVTKDGFFFDTYISLTIYDYFKAGYLYLT